MQGADARKMMMIRSRLGVGLSNSTPSSSCAPLGIIKSKHPLSQCIEYMSYYTLEGFILPLLREAPLLVHNLTFKTKIIPECYSELNLPLFRRNQGKLYEVIIGGQKSITFYIHQEQLLSIQHAATFHLRLKQKRTG